MNERTHGRTINFNIISHYIISILPRNVCVMAVFNHKRRRSDAFKILDAELFGDRCSSIVRFLWNVRAGLLLLSDDSFH